MITKEQFEKAVDRNIVVYDSYSPAGLISLRLLALMRTINRRTNDYQHAGWGKFYVHELSEGHLSDEFLALPIELSHKYDLHYEDTDFDVWYKELGCSYAPGKEFVLVGEFANGLILGNF